MVAVKLSNVSQFNNENIATPFSAKTIARVGVQGIFKYPYNYYNMFPLSLGYVSTVKLNHSRRSC